VAVARQRRRPDESAPFGGKRLSGASATRVKCGPTGGTYTWGVRLRPDAVLWR
jgi:hypothetical protein